MKKKLEADLISIAHRILKLKNKSELVQLHQETQKLYEKLSVLLFVEENFGDVKPTIGYTEIEEKLEVAFESPIETIKEEVNSIIEPVTETIEEVETLENEIESKIEEEIKEEPIVVIHEAIDIEEIQEETITELEEEKQEISEPIATEEPAFKPAFELAFDSKTEEIKEIKSKDSQISFDDLLGADYVDPVFVKPEELQKEAKLQPENVIPISRSYSENSPVIALNKIEDYKTISLNDRLSKGITIGLNDRIAFMKHLFANSSEEYNRVLNQLITFDTFQEAQSFIDNMVKPDYNNWEGKDEYAERFMEILEKKFS
ncbi:hypothetical protein [Flavobacterium luteum]|uniref:Uncharacterized protein n=1 Tax=Flavobacterium luteum TaxID=2026654 RepID=A0A7J5AEV8_9FLAO|nr:hypothetical protein [Flavobacterium luteum]KAB1156127.1 hypothetical protein F6464_07975 [Flavobacterium luteum]